MKSINQKLFALQQEIGAISKDAKNPFFKSSYFDINSLLRNIKPLLGKYKLVLHQPIIKGEVHSIIECIETNEITKPSSLELPEISDPQKLGSCITYFRRYTLVSLLGLEADDDDGNLASNKKVEVKKEDNRPWLDINQKKAVLNNQQSNAKQEAQRILNKYRMKTIWATEIKNQFKL
jgi:hypothetical protein